MKISVNAIKWHGYEELFNLPIKELAAKIGAQLGALEKEPFYLGGLYDGVVVAKVVSCEKHPNADRLNVCTIDDGGITPDVNRDANGLVQVVCGAPNVRAGLTVAWLPPGATVPSSVGKDPFVLEARELRGVVSNGMLASPHELAMSDGHSGILEITAEDVGKELTKPGTPFKQLYGLDDYIFDIENKMFTHRPDLFGQLGVGREIAGIQGIPFKSPEWYLNTQPTITPEEEALRVSVHNEIPGLVPRFVAIPMSNVTVKSSPVWLQSWLSRLGLRPINNVVDLTNYYMMLTGQPLHAYDYDKVAALSGGEGASIVVRNPKPGEKIMLLNGKEVEPRVEAIMIATDQKLIGIGGVMGGAETEVDEQTKNIILEVATFDMYSIRRTSMAHGLFTDAVTRFNKGQSPLQNMAIATKAAEDVTRLAGGRVAGAPVDDCHVDQSVIERGSVFTPVTVGRGFINERLGLNLSAEDMKQLLENVEFRVEAQGDEFTVTAPFWRTDIELREDVVEEVGRLYGFDKLPLALPQRDLTPAHRDPMLDLKSAIRDTLSRAGANEVLTYSFVHGDLFEKVGQHKDQAYRISNALSPDLQYFRLSLAPSLLEKVHPNIKAGYDQFALFEMGKAHMLGREEDGLPIEFERLALVVAADNKMAQAAFAGAPYYEAQKYLMSLLKSLHVTGDITFEPLDNTAPESSTPYFARGRAATVKIDDQIIGRIGEYKPSVRKALKLPDFVAGFELGLTPLLKLVQQQAEYRPLPRFPKVTQDISLKVANDLSYRELYDFARDELAKTQPENTLAQLHPLDIYQREDDHEHKQITLRLEIASYERTLTDAEVNKLLDAIAVAAHERFGAERI